MSLPEYYKPRDSYPLNGIQYGTGRRLIQPRFHRQMPHALQLAVCEEGMAQHLMVYQPMQKPVPVKIEWPRIDSLNLKNVGYLPIPIRDLYVVETPTGGPVIALDAVYLPDNTLQPGRHLVRRIEWLIPEKSRAWIALRLHGPWRDLMIEVTRRD